jgi:hypothetical protein
VAPSDATRAVDPNPDQHVATESLSESDTFIDIRGCGPRRDPDGSSWQAAEDLVDQGDALLDLSKADPDARIDVTRVEDRYVKFEFVIWRTGERFTRIERTAGGAADIAAGPVLTGKSGLTRWLVSGRYLSFWTSSSRLPMTFTGRPFVAFASGIASTTSSPSVRRPKPPPRNGVWTFTFSGVVPPPLRR